MKKIKDLSVFLQEYINMKDFAKSEEYIPDHVFEDEQKRRKIIFEELVEDFLFEKDGLDVFVFEEGEEEKEYYVDLFDKKILGKVEDVYLWDLFFDRTRNCFGYWDDFADFVKKNRKNELETMANDFNFERLKNKK
ncbi:MAG: hypothetical protein N3D20_02835 [Candidatus Pacearchaeota archaeon]|nr:hypothetical protein [Candidatus Pacearchaeota archaeon]